MATVRTTWTSCSAMTTVAGVDDALAAVAQAGPLVGAHAGGRLVEQQQRAAGRRARRRSRAGAAGRATGARRARRRRRADRPAPAARRPARRLRARLRRRSSPNSPRWAWTASTTFSQAGEAGHDAGQLEGAADAGPGAPARRGGAERPAVEEDLARCGRICPPSRLSTVDLPAPLGPMKTWMSCSLNVQVDGVHRLERAVRLREAARRRAPPWRVDESLSSASARHAGGGSGRRARPSSWAGLSRTMRAPPLR